jgi:peptidyl-prolyl cis-trans isomerase A (cyclophilin A)
MIRLVLASCVALCLAGCGADVTPDRSADARGAEARPEAEQPGKAAPAAPEADLVRVRLETEAGAIDLELDARRAPITTANFLAYVDQGRFDGTRFYRASRTRGATGRGFIQGGIQRNYRLMLPPIAHEPTSATGLSHVDGTVSMARTAPGTAMGEYFIVVGDMPSMDAGAGREGDDQGFAAFGRVVEGMDVVRRILAAPTVPEAGRGAMRGQMIADPVDIVRARRIE